jgi:bacterioferritin-associated ferredoxin
MYVCICNAFTDKQVKRSLDQGACSAAGIFKAMGCAPQCGTCVPYVREMVRTHIGGTAADAISAAVPAMPSEGFMLAAE